jgi:glycosyltransferase involved in cell wall biosynthesis
MVEERIRVLVAGHDLKFFRPLQKALEETGRFVFRDDVWSGHNQHDKEISRELLLWAEIIIAEWCLGNAVWYSKNKRKDQRLVVRFHLQERMTEFPTKMKTNAVERIVFVGPHIEREAHRRLGIPQDRTCVIPNFVNIERFNHEKYEGAFFNMGMIGIAPRRKRMDLAFDLLEELKLHDERYTLHIKGANPTDIDWLWARTSERKYYIEQWQRINASLYKNSVVFDPPGDDVPEWLRCIGFILSPSDFESFHMAVSEGMSSGSIPLIWDWEGADEIYPTEYVMHSVKEAAVKIEEIRGSCGLEKKCDAVRQYVLRRFDSDVIRDAWMDVLLQPDAHRATEEESRNQERLLVVVYAIDNWDIFHRREMLEALAERMAGEADFLIVEPGSHYRTILKKGWATEEELDRYIKPEAIRVAKNIWKFRMLTSGFPYYVRSLLIRGRGATVKHTNKNMIDSLFPEHHKRIYWLYKPNQRNNLLFDEDAYVYECYDEYTLSFGSGKVLANVEQEEIRTLMDARAAFFTAEPLIQRKKMHTTRPVLAENGVNFSVFSNNRTTPHGDAKVGYLGNLADFFDWESITYAASFLPDVAFYFHGPVESNVNGRAKKLAELPNCHFTGRVDRVEGAKLIAGYHALVIPFVQNPAMDAVNPLKLWEYFSVSRPVVSSPMKAISEYKDLIYFASSKQDWVEQIRRAVAEDDESKRQQRSYLAESHDWYNLTRIHAETLRDVASEI